MQRFILIDQSITGLGGHHYEYARRVLDAAREAGYEPVLATNRKCRQRCGDFPVQAAYQFGFWHRSAAPRWWTGIQNLKARLARPWFLLQIRLLLSPLGEVWANRRNALECLRRSGHLSLAHRALLIAMFAALYAARLAAGAVQLVWQCVPFRGYLAQIAAAGRRFTQVAVGPWLRYAARPQDLLKMLHAWRKSRAFGRDTARVLRAVRPADGDIIFIPTLEENEMLGLLQCLDKLPAARRLAWHLLFRRNIYVGRGVDYAMQDEHQRPLRNAFRAFQRRLDGANVQFYTDTEQLTEQYNRLGVFRFRTLPIPVDPHYRTREAAPSGPANVVYVGDARTEKGYQFIPQIVDDLWPRVQRGEVCFTLQSNFNSQQGEPSAVVAKAQLQQKQHAGVRLLDQPLTSEEYRRTVLAGDAALVLYDRDNYFARSSGIFTEAMFAGIPVVTPSGSWMALQLEGAIRAYHRQLEQRTAWRLDQLDGAALNWRLFGGGRMPRGETDLRLAGPQSRWTWLRPPAADHLILSCRPHADRSGHFLHVHLEVQDAERTELSASDHVIGGLSGAETSVLLPLPAGAHRIWLGLRGAFSHHPLVLRDLRLTWLQAGQKLPRSAAGVLVHRMEEASLALREILEHRTHYRATAEEFARTWSAAHQPRTLVRELAGLAASDGGPDLPRPHFLVPQANTVRRTA